MNIDNSYLIKNIEEINKLDIDNITNLIIEFKNNNQLNIEKLEHLLNDYQVKTKIYIKPYNLENLENILKLDNSSKIIGIILSNLDLNNIKNYKKLLKKYSTKETFIIPEINKIFFKEDLIYIFNELKDLKIKFYILNIKEIKNIYKIKQNKNISNDKILFNYFEKFYIIFKPYYNICINDIEYDFKYIGIDKDFIKIYTFEQNYDINIKLFYKEKNYHIFKNSIINKEEKY